MRRHWKIKILIILALSVGIFASLKPITANASNPTTVSFQGKVVNSNGTNVTNGTYSFLFKLYTSSSGGTAVWTETDTLTVTGGVFQVNLGANCPFFTANACNSSTPINFGSSSSLYLGITFNSDPAGEMSPRVQFQSVPYAFNADNLGGLSSAQYVQISPSSQQAGSINIGSLTVGGTINIGGTVTASTGLGILHSSSGGVLSSSAVVLGTDTSGAYLSSLGSLIGLSNTGTASVPALNVLYGSTSNTAVQGSISVICPSGTGNLTGTGNTITLGSGGTCNALNTISAPSFISQTLTNSAGNALSVSGTPTASATASQLSLGSAIAGGNSTSGTGGTYISINSPSSGAGSTADFVNFENNGTSKFAVNSSGSLVSSGAITAGVDVDSRATETAAATYSETTADVGYYLSSNSTTTNTAFTTTFNITGIPTTDGTFAAITGTSIKGVTAGAIAHTVIVQINGVTISTIATTAVTTAQTVKRSFMVMRQNAIWEVIGEGPTATPANTTSTLNVADYAEWIDYAGITQPQPGDVLSVSVAGNAAQDSSTSYDPKTIGVVSTSPYEVAGTDDGHSVVIALTGRVPVNVNLENGPIKPGDPLTASSTPGQAMKATSPGRIIGIAISAYDGSQPNSQVIVQLGVGYDDPSASSVINPDLINDGAIALNQGNSSSVQIDPSTSSGSSNTTIDTNGNSNLESLGSPTSPINLSFNQISSSSALIAQVITPQILSDGSISIDSGSNSTVSLDSQGGSVEIGANGTSNINIGNINSNTTINGNLNTNGQASVNGSLILHFEGSSDSLNIDNNGSISAIDSAINVSDKSGNGFSNIITSPSFNVDGKGNIITNGSIISRGGNLTLFGTGGAQVVSFDQSGNGNLKGNLNLSSASLSGGLSVGGDLNISGLSVFEKLATFLAKTVFKQDVEFDGHITVSGDSAGYASLRVNESSVHVTFQTPYASPPVVTSTIINGQYGLVSVNNVTDQGFDLSLPTPVSAATALSWTAVGVNNPTTSTNPLPKDTTNSTIINNVDNANSTNQN